MENSLVYMPVLRMREQEINVLNSFQFGNRIWPYIEIIRAEVPGSNGLSPELLYPNFIRCIKSQKVFVDIPVHFKSVAATDPAVTSYLRSFDDMDKRTAKLISFADGSEKMIPVICSYRNISGRSGTIQKQATDLRTIFLSIAIRIAGQDPEFESEMEQAVQCLTSNDYLIVDFKEDDMDRRSSFIKEVSERLTSFTTCPVIILKSAIPETLKYKEIEHGEPVISSDNSVVTKFNTLLNASAFGDYAGIKCDMLVKLKMTKQVVMGFYFYDPIQNTFYGFKGQQAGFSEIKDTILPAVINSDIVKNMKAAGADYLSNINEGWKLINWMNEGVIKAGNPGKLKRISMEHYLHCIRTKIENGEFD